MSKFSSFGLKPEILEALSEMGFDNPTEIQEQSIPQVLNSSQDLLALAQTGTGKTAAFSLPILQKIDKNTKHIAALVLSPTRELCLQISKDMEAFSKHMKGLEVLAVYGGTSIDTQLRALKKGKVNVVVGTPGRTLDLIRRKALKLDQVAYVVLDEADEMLNMGFREELDDILSKTPEGKQTMLFSATMPKEIQRISNKYMHDVVEIRVAHNNELAPNIEHCFTLCKSEHRFEAMRRIMDVHSDMYGIVFCRTRRDCKEIADKLIDAGYAADALNGDLSQAQRDHVMKRFRNRQLQVLVATDVAARGIDVEKLTHVIHHNIPDDPEVYVHRSGRTGRAGEKGVSVILAHSRQVRKLEQVARDLKISFQQMEIPSLDVIFQKRLHNWASSIEQLEVNEKQVAPYLDEILKRMDWMDKDLLIAKFLSLELNKLQTAKVKQADLNIEPGKRSKENKRDKFEKGGSRSRSNVDFKRYYINIGSKNNLKAPKLIGLVNDLTATKDIEFGKIEIMKGFSFFEIDESFAGMVESGFQGESWGSVQLKLEPAESTGPSSGKFKADSGKRRSNSRGKDSRGKKKGGGHKRRR